jgi:hypothetical protein
MDVSTPPIPTTIIDALNRGDIANSLELFEQFLSAQPGAHQARMALVNLYLQTQKFDRTLPHLRLLARDHPDPQVFFTLAIVSESFGFIEEARVQLERALKLDPANISFLDAAVRIANKATPGSATSIIESACKHIKERPELFQFLASSTSSLEQHIHQSIYRNNERILFIGIGHSAGSYITAELARRLGMHMWLEPIALGQAHHAYLNEASLEKFLKLGGVNHSHMFPGEMNREMLLISGLKKLVINVRDPRQIALSNTHWMLELKKRHSEQGISRYEPASLKGYLPENFYSLSFEAQVDWMIEIEIPILVNWMQGWYDFCQAARGRIETRMLRFEDFKTDEPGYFIDILNFYGIRHSEWQGAPLICTPKADGRPGAHAFRKGKIDEWRHEMTTRQQERCNQLISDEFLSQFGYTR